MDSTTKHFEELLRELERARMVDEELHRRNGSLSERVTSHDTLSRLRAEIAQVRGTHTSAPAGLLDAGDSGRGSHIGWT